MQSIVERDGFAHHLYRLLVWHRLRCRDSGPALDRRFRMRSRDFVDEGLCLGCLLHRPNRLDDAHAVRSAAR